MLDLILDWTLAAILLAVGSLAGLLAVQAYRRQYLFRITVTAAALAVITLTGATAWPLIAD